jgi:hypothetical protein
MTETDPRFLYGIYNPAVDPTVRIRSRETESTATTAETLVEQAEETEPTTDETPQPGVLDLTEKVRSRIRLQDSYDLVNVPLSFGLKKKPRATHKRAQRIPESLGNILGGLE